MHYSLRQWNGLKIQFSNFTCKIFKLYNFYMYRTINTIKTFVYHIGGSTSSCLFFNFTICLATRELYNGIRSFSNLEMVYYYYKLYISNIHIWINISNRSESKMLKTFILTVRSSDEDERSLRLPCEMIMHLPFRAERGKRIYLSEGMADNVWEVLWLGEGT